MYINISTLLYFLSHVADTNEHMLYLIFVQKVSIKGLLLSVAPRMQRTKTITDQVTL